MTGRNNSTCLSMSICLSPISTFAFPHLVIHCIYLLFSKGFACVCVQLVSGMAWKLHSPPPCLNVSLCESHGLFPWMCECAPFDLKMWETVHQVVCLLCVNDPLPTTLFVRLFCHCQPNEPFATNKWNLLWQFFSSICRTGVDLYRWIGSFALPGLLAGETGERQTDGWRPGQSNWGWTVSSMRFGSQPSALSPSPTHRPPNPQQPHSSPLLPPRTTPSASMCTLPRLTVSRDHL